MKILTALCLVLFAAITAFAWPQPPGRGPGGPGRPGGPGGPGRSNGATTLDAFVAKWLTMDENSDGKIDKKELRDSRLTHLFAATDKNQDDVVDRDEIKLLFDATANANRGRGPGGPGGPRDRGPGGGRNGSR